MCVSQWCWHTASFHTTEAKQYLIGTCIGFLAPIFIKGFLWKPIDLFFFHFNFKFWNLKLRIKQNIYTWHCGQWKYAKLKLSGEWPLEQWSGDKIEPPGHISHLSYILGTFELDTSRSFMGHSLHLQIVWNNIFKMKLHSQLLAYFDLSFFFFFFKFQNLASWQKCIVES